VIALKALGMEIIKEAENQIGMLRIKSYIAQVIVSILGEPEEWDLFSFHLI
jgi:hypothetical protein